MGLTWKDLSPELKVKVSLAATGKTQTELAGDLDVTRQHLSGVINGHIVPSPRIARELSTRFGVPPEEWAAFVERKQKQKEETA